MEQDLTLREALAEDRLDDFVRQEEARGVEVANGSELERALALLITKRRVLVAPAQRPVRLTGFMAWLPSRPSRD